MSSAVGLLSFSAKPALAEADEDTREAAPRRPKLVLMAELAGPDSPGRRPWVPTQLGFDHVPKSLFV